MNCSRNKNLELYQSESNLEAYLSDYKLQPAEKILFQKYLPSPTNVLDLGCGGGRVALALHEAGHKVTAVDINGEIIERAAKRFPYINFRQGDACTLQFADNTFEAVVFSYNGLDYLRTNTERFCALREIERVLKPDGIFIFSLHNLDYLSLGPFAGGSLRLWLKYLFEYRKEESVQVVEIEYGGFNTFYTRTSEVKNILENAGFVLLDSKGNREHSKKAKIFEAITRKRFVYEPWIYYAAKATRSSKIVDNVK